LQYTQVPHSYKYEVIADAIYAREIEYFHYNFDRINFEFLISRLPDGPYKEDVCKRLLETQAHMKNVLVLIEALRAQIDDEQAYLKAVETGEERRKIKDAK